MSRIGKQPLLIPKGVSLDVVKSSHGTEKSKSGMCKVSVKGEKGCLVRYLPSFLSLRPVDQHQEGNTQTPHATAAPPNSTQPKPPQETSEHDSDHPETYTQTYSEGDKLIIEQESSLSAKFLSQSRVSSFRGMYRTLLGNMITGVSSCFEKELVMNGVGYRAEKVEQPNAVSGKPTDALRLYVGYSHPVTIEVPPLITVKLETPTKISIRGIDKESVGTFAAKVRSTRPPEPYKGKGISYAGERIKRKAVKASK